QREALLASMRDGVDAVRALEGAEGGAVTLALVGTLASTTLTGCLQGLREAYPRVDLRLRTALSSEVSALVRRGDATLGLRYGADPHPDLVSATIHHEPMVAVCSPRHRLAPRPGLAPPGTGAAGTRRRALDRLSVPGGRFRRALHPVAPPAPRRLRAGRRGDRPHRQPHRSEADGRGRVRAGAAPGEQRRRGAPRGDPVRAPDLLAAGAGADRADPRARGVPGRGGAGADGRAHRVAAPPRLAARAKAGRSYAGARLMGPGAPPGRSSAISSSAKITSPS